MAESTMRSLSKGSSNFEFNSAAPKLPAKHDRLQLPPVRLTFER